MDLGGVRRVEGVIESKFFVSIKLSKNQQNIILKYISDVSLTFQQVSKILDCKESLKLGTRAPDHVSLPACPSLPDCLSLSFPLWATVR